MPALQLFIMEVNVLPVIDLRLVPWQLEHSLLDFFFEYCHIDGIPLIFWYNLSCSGVFE